MGSINQIFIFITFISRILTASSFMLVVFHELVVNLCYQVVHVGNERRPYLPILDILPNNVFEERMHLNLCYIWSRHWILV